MLRNMFNEFDNMCLVHNVFKVCTIGDCYVVMGITDAASSRNIEEEAKNVVDYGFSMIDII